MNSTRPPTRWSTKAIWRLISGALTESEAVHEVVITYRAFVPPDFFGPVVNQAQANWDANGDGSVEDDIAGGQIAVISDDPATTGVADPTIVTVPESPGACLFQVRAVAEGGEGDNDTDDIEHIDNPVEGGFENGDIRQGNAEILGLTTPQSGQVISGNAVAVAALQGPSTGLTATAPIRVTVDNANPQVLPDIVEGHGTKTEAIPGQQDQTVVTSAAVLIHVPAGALMAEDTIEVSELSAAQVPLPLPGDAVSGFYQLTTVATGEAALMPVTVRLPYDDADQNGGG